MVPYMLVPSRGIDLQSRPFGESWRLDPICKHIDGKVFLHVKPCGSVAFSLKGYLITDTS